MTANDRHCTDYQFPPWCHELCLVTIQISSYCNKANGRQIQQHSCYNRIRKGSTATLSVIYNDIIVYAHCHIVHLSGMLQWTISIPHMPA